MEPIVFKAEIKQHQNQNAAYVDFPFSVEEIFGKKGQVKIKATFDNRVDYRGSLAKMGGTCHRLGLTQEVRAALGKTFGDEVSVVLVQDLEERVVEIPEDVQPLFDAAPQARTMYDALSYTHRKEFMRWITSAKKPETRERRKAQLIDLILSGKKGV
ncbi:YdeI/OmpD-associated family protein [Riemerella columbina]|uniref:YdeI/OmpD-associated family protein n=1 Tax=Riemerella columbina TaxID=103810 RepID=UPI00266F95CE|nr:YdeI/OmpD-associated family protein [Riemerella columbina]WKS95417.1 YdeI/OmpD-associated family protein [Riemerella columbina]